VPVVPRADLLDRHGGGEKDARQRGRDLAFFQLPERAAAPEPAVMGHPFLVAIYAAARRHLEKAREAEEMALEFAIQQYRAGHVGRTARRLYAHWDAKRTLSLRLALECRAKASRLRAELRELERCHDTEPPASGPRAA